MPRQLMVQVCELPGAMVKITDGKAVAQRSSRPSSKLEDVGSNPTCLATFS